MALGRAQVQQGFDDPRVLLGDRLREGSLYRLLADHGLVMFPDDYFADLYAESAKGRPTVPARVVATVMVLQSFEGLSDREAIDRLEVDLRWQAAAGVDAGCRGFHPTVLVGMRNRLRASARPRRLFEDTKVVARATGAMRDRARALDSTPVFDAVATQDTVTQLRAAIRKVLAGLDQAASPVAADRVISTVDTQARHGRKSRNRRFDGYKAHLSVDPDSELIDEVAASPANAPDRDAAEELLDDHARSDTKPEVVGDSAYGDAATRAGLEAAGFTVVAKCPPARNAAGRFPKDRFIVDLGTGTVICPAGHTAPIIPARDGGGKASFRPWCATCPLRSACTAARRGRTIAIHPHEAVLQRARTAQRDPAWQQCYKADRP